MTTQQQIQQLCNLLEIQDRRVSILETENARQTERIRQLTTLLKEERMANPKRSISHHT